jgi:hypothetical protein
MEAQVVLRQLHDSTPSSELLGEELQLDPSPILGGYTATIRAIDTTCVSSRFRPAEQRSVDRARIGHEESGHQWQIVRSRTSS